MIQLGTLLKVTDNSGVVLVQCIKVLNLSDRRIARIGDVILVTVKKIYTKQFSSYKFKVKKRKKFLKGSLSRALIVRSSSNFKRLNGIYIRFNENSVILVNKRTIPISSRVFGPILKELCIRWPSLGCITRFVF